MAPVFTIGPQATSLKTRLRIRFSASGHLLKRCSEPRPGSATHGYKKSEYETTTQVSSLTDEGVGSELWWWIGSNGATHTNPDGKALGPRLFPHCKWPNYSG